MHTDLIGWFKQDHWEARKRQVIDHYCFLIQTELKVGRPEDALQLFRRACNLVTLDPFSNRSLAEAAANMGLTDPGSAILYLNSLREQVGTGDERRRMFELLRQAIRIDVAFPDEATLPEHRKLNDQYWAYREDA